MMCESTTCEYCIKRDQSLKGLRSLSNNHSSVLEGVWEESRPTPAGLRYTMLRSGRLAVVFVSAAVVIAVIVEGGAALGEERWFRGNSAAQHTFWSLNRATLFPFNCDCYDQISDETRNESFCSNSPALYERGFS